MCLDTALSSSKLVGLIRDNRLSMRLQYLQFQGPHAIGYRHKHTEISTELSPGVPEL